MRNAGRVVSKTMILSHVWGYDFDPGSNVVDVLVFRLRDKSIATLVRPCSTRSRRRVCPQAATSGIVRTFGARIAPGISGFSPPAA